MHGNKSTVEKKSIKIKSKDRWSTHMHSADKHLCQLFAKMGLSGQSGLQVTIRKEVGESLLCGAVNQVSVASFVSACVAFHAATFACNPFSECRRSCTSMFAVKRESSWDQTRKSAAYDLRHTVCLKLYISAYSARNQACVRAGESEAERRNDGEN